MHTSDVFEQLRNPDPARQYRDVGNERGIAHELFPRAGFDEHAEASPGLDQLLVNQLLICLQDRERIDPIFGCDVAHGWQRIAFVEHAVEYHMDDTIAKLSINRLTIVPFTIHPV